MSKKDKVEEISEEATVETPTVEIIRGRMPVAIVAVIRHHQGEATTSELATRYRTTAGKIADIKKGSNFPYVTEDYTFTKDQLADAKERAEKLDDTDEILELIGKLSEGSDEVIKAQDESRKATRKPRGKTKDTAEEAEVEAAPEVEGDAELDDDLDDLLGQQY